MATVNVATMRGKEEEMVEVMNERKIVIMGLCETRYKGSADMKVHNDYRLLCSGSDDGRHGVGFLVAPEVARCIDTVDQVDHRIISISLRLGEEGISIVQIYAPQQGRTSAEKEEFYGKLQQTVDGVKYGDRLIISGDWNGHVGSRIQNYENIIGPHSIGSKNAEGDRILNFAGINNLSIMNTFYQHQESHKWTWYRWDGARREYTEKSMIDLIATNSKNLICDVKAIPSLSFDSDHRLVVAKLRLRIPPKRPGRKHRKFNLQKLNLSSNVDHLQAKVRERLERIEPVDDVEAKWKSFSEGLKMAAEDVIGVKEVYSGKKKTTPWWTMEMKNSVKTKMQAFRLWMKTRAPEHRIDYVQKRNETERVKKIEKDKVWNKIGRELKEDHRGTKKLLFSLAKNYRGKNKEITHAIKDKEQNLLVNPNEISERWREYFEELLNSGDDGANNDSNEEDLENQQSEYAQEDWNITEQELETAVKAMKTGKSTGEDGLPVEIIKAAGHTARKLLLDLCNTAFGKEIVPDDWQKGVVCPIYKKGERVRCDNHRGVMLLSHTGKIYNRIIEKRLRTYVENALVDGQYGFRPGRGTSDLIFTMRMILEKSWEWNKDKYILFIDLEKAFDSVERGSLWTILADEHYNIPPKLIRVIKNLYSKCPTKVKSPAQDSKWFEVNRGVRQGDVLSPLLFVIFMDKCMREIGVGELGEETMVYADDVAVVTDNLASLHEVAERWHEGMTRNGMKINTGPGKTEFMVVSRREHLCNLGMAEKHICKVEKYKYLGVHLDDKNDRQVEINARISKYNNALSMLYPILKEKSIPKECKTTIYTMVLRPILTYGCEAWVLTTKTESQIQAAEMRALRLIRGVTRRDKFRNTRIREDLGVSPLMEFVGRRQLQWYGHVKRMEDERYPKKYLAWQPRGRRPVGRPRKRWLDCVDEKLRDRGTSVQEVETTRLFEDRGRWRLFIHGRPADR